MESMRKILPMAALAASMLAACAPTAAYTGPSYVALTTASASIDGQPVPVATTEKAWTLTTPEYSLVLNPDSNTPDMSGFGFLISNKTNSTMKVIWDESVISVLSMPSAVYHEGIKYIDREAAKPPTIIPAAGNLVEVLYPTKYTYYDDSRYTGGWKQRPLGTNVGVLLALEVNGKRQNVSINLKAK